MVFDANYDTTYEIESGNDYVDYDRLMLKNEILIGCGCNPDVLEGWPTVFNTYEIKKTVYVDKLVQKTVDTARMNRDNWTFKATREVVLEVKFDLHGTFWTATHTSVTGWGIIIKAYVNDSFRIIYENYHSSTNIDNGVIRCLESRTIKLNPGETLYFTVEAFESNQEIGCNGTITLAYNSQNRPKSIPGLRPAELLSELVSRATGGQYSNIDAGALAQGEIGNMLITSGDLIRGIRNGKIKTSLKDFFEAMKALFGLAFTFHTVVNKATGASEEELVVKHINDMFRKDQQLTAVDDIRDLRDSIANDDICNKLKVGYKNQTYDEVNGKFEFNTEVQFGMFSEVTSKELKLISPYRADMYGIEFLIIGYESEDTKDSKDDNDVFIFHTHTGAEGCIPNRKYTLENSDVKPAADSTVFNVYLSPRNCLMRQLEYLRSMFMFSGTSLQFTSSTREFEAVTSNCGGERQNIGLEGPALYEPVIYEFETMVPINIAELMRDKYNGFVTATDGRRTVRGFVLSVSENPGRNKSQTWKLLAMADE